MLESTFQHIQGVGERTERHLWERGCKNWDLLIHDDFNLPKDTYRRLKAGVMESKCRLESMDHDYFRNNLPRSITWRAYENFRNHACFMDIETTGLSPEHDDVTTVCVHSPAGTESYVAGKNLGRLRDDLREFRYIVSFNGSRFDLPFLTRRMGVRFNQIHLDLLYPLRRLGYSGGLKRIEKMLGFSRDTEGVDGYDAVRLWRAYRKNSEVEVAGRRVSGEDALNLLVDYNREDTVNLESITEFVVKEMRERHRRYL
ncbi:MAG: ribonuclease H-like domain-containing protein [Candidatus Altiarchaeota archaeon]